MDRAELEVRRHPRRVVQVGPVAFLWVADEATPAEPAPGRQRGGLPRLREGQPGGQVGVVRDAGAVQGPPADVARAGPRGRAPAMLGPGPVERRVHLERRAVPLGHPARGYRVGRSGPHQRRVPQRGGNPRVAGRAVRGEVRADVDRGGADFARDRGDDVLRPAAPDREGPAVLTQLLIEGAQRPYKNAMRGAPDGLRNASPVRRGPPRVPPRRRPAAPDGHPGAGRGETTVRLTSAQLPSSGPRPGDGQRRPGAPSVRRNLLPPPAAAFTKVASPPAGPATTCGRACSAGAAVRAGQAALSRQELPTLLGTQRPRGRRRGCAGPASRCRGRARSWRAPARHVAGPPGRRTTFGRPNRMPDRASGAAQDQAHRADDGESLGLVVTRRDGGSLLYCSRAFGAEERYGGRRA